jgi:glucose/arabinose dehydrogenase
VSFSRDGRIFVAEKRGIIKVFSGLSDTTPDVVADLRTNVHDYWDRGMLGMALHPDFPATNAIYALYTYDAPLGRTAPVYNDACADPTGNGCVVSGRLSRLTNIGGAASSVTENVLISDWCQQFPSHSIGSISFGPDGALYVSGGDGASFNGVDYGQYGSPPILAAILPAASAGGCRRPSPMAAPCAPRTFGPHPIRRPSMGRCCGWTRPPARGCRTTRSPRARIRTRGASSPTGCATRSG